MPTKRITVCVYCGKVSCDGARWRYHKIIKKSNKEEVNLSSIHVDLMEGCSLYYGESALKNLINKKIGDLVTLTFDNWCYPSLVGYPSLVTLIKIED